MPQAQGTGHPPPMCVAVKAFLAALFVGTACRHEPLYGRHSRTDSKLNTLHRNGHIRNDVMHGSNKRHSSDNGNFGALD